jgi:putative peptidoglycan lipid II flippase
LPAGSVARINYGSKIVIFILTLIATSLGAVLIPYFSNMVARKEWSTLRLTFRSYLQLVFLITVPLTLLVVYLSKPLVEILFQRGSFTPTDAETVARVQALFALQIPFFVAGIVTVRVISSIRANDILLKAAAINLLVNVVLNYLFVKWIGLAGIALSTSFVYLISFGYCFTMLHRRMTTLQHEVA